MEIPKIGNDTTVNHHVHSSLSLCWAQAGSSLNVGSPKASAFLNEVNLSSVIQRPSNGQQRPLNRKALTCLS